MSKHIESRKKKNKRKSQHILEFNDNDMFNDDEVEEQKEPILSAGKKLKVEFVLRNEYLYKEKRFVWKKIFNKYKKLMYANAEQGCFQLSIQYEHDKDIKIAIDTLRLYSSPDVQEPACDYINFKKSLNEDTGKIIFNWEDGYHHMSQILARELYDIAVLNEENANKKIIEYVTQYCQDQIKKTTKISNFNYIEVDEQELADYYLKDFAMFMYNDSNKCIDQEFIDLLLKNDINLTVNHDIGIFPGAKKKNTYQIELI